MEIRSMCVSGWRVNDGRSLELHMAITSYSIIIIIMSCNSTYLN